MFILVARVLPLSVLAMYSRYKKLYLVDYHKYYYHHYIESLSTNIHLNIAALEMKTEILQCKGRKASAHHLPFTKFKSCCAIAAMWKCIVFFTHKVSFSVRAGTWQQPKHVDRSILSIFGWINVPLLDGHKINLDTDGSYVHALNMAAWTLQLPPALGS